MLYCLRNTKFSGSLWCGKYEVSFNKINVIDRDDEIKLIDNLKCENFPMKWSKIELILCLKGKNFVDFMDIQFKTDRLMSFIYSINTSYERTIGGNREMRFIGKMRCDVQRKINLWKFIAVHFRQVLNK